MKFTRILAMVAAIATAVPAFAYFYVEPDCDFESGGLYYKICDDGLEIAISGYYHDGTEERPGWPFHAEYAGDIDVPESVYVPSLDRELPVVSVGEFAFSCCDNLRSVKFPSSLTRIGENVFMYSNKVECVDMSECIGITEFPESMFARTPSLKMVLSPPYLRKIGNLAFYDSGLTEYDIPDNVMIICSLSLCSTNLQYVKFGKSLRTVDGAFTYLSKLETIEWNDSLENIMKRSFFDCKKLTQIELPKSVRTIGNGAFAEINGLKSVVCHVENPSDISTDSMAFAIADDYDDWWRGWGGAPLEGMAYSPVPEGCVLYVPAQSVELYRQAEVWKEFAEIRAIGDNQTALEEVATTAAPAATYDLMGRRVTSPRPGQLVVSGGRLRFIR